MSSAKISNGGNYREEDILSRIKMQPQYFYSRTDMIRLGNMKGMERMPIKEKEFFFILLNDRDK